MEGVAGASGRSEALMEGWVLVVPDGHHFGGGGGGGGGALGGQVNMRAEKTVGRDWENVAYRVPPVR